MFKCKGFAVVRSLYGHVVSLHVVSSFVLFDVMFLCQFRDCYLHSGIGITSLVLCACCGLIALPLSTAGLRSVVIVPRNFFIGVL